MMGNNDYYNSNKIYNIVNIKKLLIILIVAFLFSFLNACDFVRITLVDGSTTETIYYPDKVNIPTKEYNKFLGYFDDNNVKYIDSNGNYIYEIYESITLHARWEGVDIRFNFNDSINESIIKKYGDKVQNFPESYKEDHKFIGWFDKNDKQISDGTKVKVNNIKIDKKDYYIENNTINLYPKFELNYYDVHFIYNTNKEVSNKYYSGYELSKNDYYDLFDYYEDNNGIGYGVRNWIVKENDTITGEVFNGTIKKNCTLIAHYMPCNKIKLNYSDTYIYGYIFEDFQLIKDPVLEGYTFIGWQDQFGTVITDFTNIDSNMELYAKWEANKYSITMKVDGEEDAILNVTYNESFVLPIPNKNGHTFIGWYYENQLFEENKYTRFNDITLSAKFEVNKYIISFNGLDNKLEPMTYEYGQITQDVIISDSENAIFKNWSFNISNFKLGDPMPAENIIATANWSYTKVTKIYSYNKIIDGENSDYNVVTDYIDSGLDSNYLFEKGYRTLKITVKFECQIINKCDQIIKLYSNASASISFGEETFEYVDDVIFPTHEYETTILLSALNNDAIYFEFLTESSFWRQTEWKLLNVTYTFEALK